MDLDGLFETRALADSRWSVDIRGEGRAGYRRNAGLLLETASVAKVFLLVELAARIVSGHIDLRSELDRRTVAPVGDSGLWQHLVTERLPVTDAATLVGSLSDNLATNVLIRLVGLEAIQARAARVAPGGSTLLDIVRDTRDADAPATLSKGCASDWASVFEHLRRRAAESDVASTCVLDWLAAGVDLSMVASAFELDPLSHASNADQHLRVWNKTGTETGVRADVGIVELEGTNWTYAVICNWNGHDARILPEVLGTMREIGLEIRRAR